MKKNRLTGKVVGITLATLLGLSFLVGLGTYVGSCVKNGADATNETIKGWFETSEQDSTSDNLDSSISVEPSSN